MPISASANIVWPSLYIAEGMRSWYIILIGLVIESVFVRFYLKETYLKSTLIAFVMNLISTIVGIILIPLSGFIAVILMAPFEMATFDSIIWVVSYVFAIASNVLVEGLSVKFLFKQKFRSMFWWLFVANAISVLICILFNGTEMQNIYT
jgi:hypothetical protein